MKKLLINESEKREILSLYNISFNNQINEAVSRPTNYNDIMKFQNWVLNTIKDKNILGTYGADGKWGNKSQAAWNLYGGRYGKSNNNNKISNNSNKFPYNKLNNNPSTKFIAWTIKKSDGGYLGNDTEAYAEAAFNAIKTPQQYSEVAKYLGQDPYTFISTFMDTKTRYHLKSVHDRYVELYKTEPDDRPKQLKPNNVKDFQLWVINTKKDKEILGKFGADGDWGANSVKAWYKYGNEYLKTNKNVVTNDKSNLMVSKTLNPEYKKYIVPNKINPRKSNYLGNLDFGVDTCAAFVHSVDSEMPFVGDAWLAYNNTDLGPLVFSSFKDLSPDNIKKLGDMYALIKKNNGGQKDGKFNNQVGSLVKSFIKPVSTTLQIGDFIGMYNPGSHNHEKALYQASQNPKWYNFAYENPYFTKDGKPNVELFKDNDGIGLNTHVGMVGAIKDGVPIIYHSEDGKFYADPVNNIVGGGKVAWVRRLGSIEPVAYSGPTIDKSIT